MSDPKVPNETVSVHERECLFRCACGHDVRVLGGRGSCQTCGRPVVLAALDASQTLSFMTSGSESSDGQECDRAGQRLGHFRLLTMLGQGGMGAVYRALDESLQRFVAVKVMRSPSAGSSSTTRVSQLMDEAVAQARLNHPHVVTIYYVGRDEADPFLAMELLPGPTLDKKLLEGPLPYPQLIRFARQTTSALAQATRLNIVHGDIKPSNLILANADTVKLSDFGLAYMDQKSSPGISGTLNYMAPELADGVPPSAQSDMYALGITLFELTFGRRPYALSGQTLVAQLESHRSADVEFPEKWPTSIPRRWRSILGRLLAKDPGQRYPNYESLEADLRAIAPVGVTLAGRLNRLLALGVDSVVQLAVMGVLGLPAFIALQTIREIPPTLRDVGTAVVGLLMLLVPAAMLGFDWMEGRTPGRFLFQLRVVDSHGLGLSRRRQLLRGLIRNAPVWMIAISICASTLGLSTFSALLGPLTDVLILINAVAIFGPRRLTIHDRLFGTRVVLDTTT